MDVSAFSEPEKVGPGYWHCIHVDAANAVTDELKRAFVININARCDHFKCKKCQGHFRKFIDSHPLKHYWNIKDNKGNDIGFFKWTWELHNQVNRFLKKYEPSLEEAYGYYSKSDAGVCFDCGKGPEDHKSLDHGSVPIVTKVKLPEDNKVDKNDQISRAIPYILTLYRQNGDIKPVPFNPNK